MLLMVRLCRQYEQRCESWRRDRANPLHAAILRGFRDRTGLPVLVNTSFNVHEEPIVNQPSECLQALRDRRVDFVVTEQAVYSP